MKSVLLYLGFCFLIVLSACSTGRRSLEKGDYDKAVYQAVNRLKQDTDNRKAMQTLKKAYQYAEETHLTRVRELSLSSDILRWEAILNEYQALNNLSDEIRRCPSCRDAIGEPRKYVQEADEARHKAAEVRYARGLKLLAENIRESAKMAYFDFEKAEQLQPGFKDAKLKMDEAYWAAALKVVLEPVQVNRGVYAITNEYFQNKIFEYLLNYEKRSFIKFFSPEEAKRTKLVPNQVLTLSFDDFAVGQTYIKERVEEVKRDSVKIGVSARQENIFGTVKAQYTHFEKTITSSGLLDFRILDWKTKNIITNEKMPGTFVWSDEWGTYKGDERALNEMQKKMSNRRESPAPPPQALFIEFTKPIYDQLVDKINAFYRRY